MVIKRSPGGQACRWRAINFEIHLWSSGKNADCIWRSICIQHVQIEAGLNSDPGNDSFSDKIRDAKHVDRSTHYSTRRSTQVKSASTDLWPQEMFTFSEMLALFRVGKQFRCLRLSKEAWGLHGDQPSCYCKLSNRNEKMTILSTVEVLWCVCQ